MFEKWATLLYKWAKMIYSSGQARGAWRKARLSASQRLCAPESCERVHVFACVRACVRGCVRVSADAKSFSAMNESLYNNLSRVNGRIPEQKSPWQLHNEEHNVTQHKRSTTAPCWAAYSELFAHSTKQIFNLRPSTFKNRNYTTLMPYGGMPLSEDGCPTHHVLHDWIM